MDMPPYLTDDQRRRDNDQIHLLSIFHFVLGALALLGIGFLCLHYLIVNYIFSHPEMMKTNTNLDAAKAIFSLIIWFYLFAGFLLAVACVANILSGIFLLQRKNRMFSLVVAGLDCLQIPFGTALGVFTFIVLLRDSVRQSYPV
jgi:magnesium-transporting ATPase (P-type)